MKRILALAVALALLLTAAAQAETVKDITRKVKISASTGDVSKLTDGYIRTFFIPNDGIKYYERQ